MLISNAHSRFINASRVLEAAESEGVYCDELPCYISTSAAYNTAYGQEWARRRGHFVNGYPRHREERGAEYSRRDYTMPMQKNNQPYQQRSHHQNQSPPGGPMLARQAPKSTAGPQVSASRVSPGNASGSRSGSNGVPMIQQLAVSSGFVQPGQPGYPASNPQPGLHGQSGQTQVPPHLLIPAPIPTSAAPWAMQGQVHPVYPISVAQTPSGQFVPTIGGVQPFHQQLEVRHPAALAAIPNPGLSANKNPTQPSKVPISEKTDSED